MATPIAVATVEKEVGLVSWGAVIAGGIAAAAISLVLLAFGIGVGFSVVSPWANEGVSATTFHVGAGIYLVVVAMLASTVGGYLAGRMRGRWAVHRDEVFFRDTAHGFLAWAFATVLTAAALGTATTSILSGATAGIAPAAATAGVQAGQSPSSRVTLISFSAPLLDPPPHSRNSPRLTCKPVEQRSVAFSPVVCDGALTFRLATARTSPKSYLRAQGCRKSRRRSG